MTSPNDWVTCVDPENIENCALKWAEESNAFTCSYVYGPGFNISKDLAGDYLTGATPIVETQVAKGINVYNRADCSRIETCCVFEYDRYWAARMGC